MKSLIFAVIATIALTGCAVGVSGSVGHHSGGVGVSLYLWDSDRGQHYYHDRHGNRQYMDKGWKHPGK